MKVESTPLDGLLILTPAIYPDARGFLYESYNEDRFAAALGRRLAFVQDNHSLSHRRVLRGLHFQTGTPQAKLVRVVQGTIFDVCVDLRRSSPGFGKWFGVELSAANRKQLFIPQGFAHGFLTLSMESEVLYKLDALYDPTAQGCLRWDDPEVGISWPLEGEPLLSAKDQQGLALCDLAGFP